MDIKGIYNEVDDYQYIFKGSNLEKIGDTIRFTLIFSYSKDGEYVGDKIVQTSGELYQTWNDLTDAYKVLANELGIEISPISRDWELGLGDVPIKYKPSDLISWCQANVLTPELIPHMAAFLGAANWNTLAGWANFKVYADSVGITDVATTIMNKAKEFGANIPEE